jgi:hypothetical protein
VYWGQMALIFYEDLLLEGNSADHSGRHYS